MKKKILIILIISIIFPLTVNAANKSISIECTPSSVVAGGNISCVVSGTSDIDIASLEFAISLGDGLSFASKAFDQASGWLPDSPDNGKIEINRENSDFVNGSFAIGTLNIVAASSIQAGNVAVELKDVTFYNDDGGEFPAVGDTSSITITEPPEEVKKGLSSLSVTNGVLSPNFRTDNTGYTVRLDSYDTSTFSITAVAANTNDSVAATYNDGEPLNSLNNITFTSSAGQALMIVTLTVGTGSNQISYDLSISRPDAPEKPVASLKSLTVGGKNITLYDNIFTYSVELDDVSNYIVTPTINDTTNFRLSNTVDYSSAFHDEGDIIIVIEPIDTSIGLETVSYTITVNKINNGGDNPIDVSPEPTKKPSNTDTNPGTGVPSMIMALILIISFITSMYYYKKNTSDYS